MAKTWVLDTDTKGTGARVVPLERVLEKPAPEDRPAPRTERGRPARPAPPAPKRRRPLTKTSAGPLPPGHVRKRATGEIGRVLSVDARAGTATVRWLRQGRSSSVPLSAISRS